MGIITSIIVNFRNQPFLGLIKQFVNLIKAGTSLKFKNKKALNIL